MNDAVFKPLGRNKLTDKAIAQVEDLINNGTLKPGDRLPPESEMSLQLNVSRSILREALKTLECLGYISRRPGGGTFVHNVTEWKNGALLTDLLKRAAYLDYLEAREMLEQKVVELVIERATDKELDDFERFVSEFEDSDTYSEVMMQFHYKLASLTRNAVLINFMLINWELHKHFSLISDENPDQDRRRAVIEEHRAMLDAIKQRNVRKAQQAVLDHLRGVRLYRQATVAAGS